jgi:SAM-dependent methyltransferase
MSDKAFDQWAEAHKLSIAEGAELVWPSETLVRLFKGNYVPGLKKNYVGAKVIEVGFGNGHNLAFLGSLGLHLSGTEVHEDICRAVRERFAKLGYESDLRVGANRTLPFQDNEFDFLVSWNVVHYEDNEVAIREAIAEYHRVLKPGGRFFVSTTGPEHKILMSSTSLGKHRYCIGRQDDFRKGQVFFYFDTDTDAKFYFSEKFSEVLVGRIHNFLLTETLDSFIVTGVKV